MELYVSEEEGFSSDGGRRRAHCSDSGVLFQSALCRDTNTFSFLLAPVILSFAEVHKPESTFQVGLFPVLGMCGEIVLCVALDFQI